MLETRFWLIEFQFRNTNVFSFDFLISFPYNSYKLNTSQQSIRSRFVDDEDEDKKRRQKIEQIGALSAELIDI
jgi:hypothetical protein